MLSGPFFWGLESLFRDVGGRLIGGGWLSLISVYTNVILLGASEASHGSSHGSDLPLRIGPVGPRSNVAHFPWCQSDFSIVVSVFS